MKKRISTQMDMTSGPMGRKMLLFAIPIIFSNILQVLFNTVDMIIVGRFAGDQSLAAVGSTMSVTGLFVELFIGLSIGANVVAANRFGAKDTASMGRVVNTAIYSSIISGIIILILGVIFTNPMLIAMDTPEDVLPLAETYLRIYFCGMPFLMIYDFGAALLRAKGDTKRPLYFMSIAGALNLGLNCVFVICFHMSVAGVATATVISEGLSAVLVLIVLLRETDEMRFVPKNGFFDLPILKEMFRIGLPAGIQGILFAISNILIQSSMNSFGSTVVAGNSAIINVSGFVYLSMSAFYTAALSFSGQNYGAKLYRRIDQSMWICLIYVGVIGTVGPLLIWAFANPLLGLYTTSDAVIAAAMVRLKYGVIYYGFLGAMEVVPATLRGMKVSVTPTVVTLLGSCVLRIVWIETIFRVVHTPANLYVSYPISWVVTFAAQLICYYVVRRKLDAEEKG